MHIQFLGLITFGMLLILCPGCALFQSDEITVSFVNDIKDLADPSIPMDVMILDNNETEEKTLIELLKKSDERYKWFIDPTPTFREIRTKLERMPNSRYRRINIEPKKVIMPVKLYVGDKRDHSTLFAVLFIDKDNDSCDKYGINGFDEFLVTVRKDSVTVTKKEL